MEILTLCIIHVRIKKRLRRNIDQTVVANDFPSSINLIPNAFRKNTHTRAIHTLGPYTHSGHTHTRAHTRAIHTLAPYTHSGHTHTRAHTRAHIIEPFLRK